jgi:rubrerythrin
MTTSDTIGHLFELSIALEQTAEMFYRGLAARFAHAPEAAAFWKDYADEEAGHARWLEDLRAQLDESKLRQPANAALVDSARRQLKTTPEEALKRITNLEEACQTAIEMENSETNTIFEFLITDYALTNRSRNFLRAQLHNHADKVTREFPAAFQSRMKRLEVKAKTGA